MKLQFFTLVVSTFNLKTFKNIIGDVIILKMRSLHIGYIF